jgi:hypothetical protein
MDGGSAIRLSGTIIAASHHDIAAAMKKCPSMIADEYQ